jgi:CheY-like chemotaxis protein
VRRILYVEDNETNFRLGIRVLTLTGKLSITHAPTGELAMEHLRSAAWDAIVLDLDLPGIDGVELLEWMREEGLEVPVVVVTASVMQRERQRTLELGARAFLEKPVDIGELRTTVLAAAGA